MSAICIIMGGAICLVSLDVIPADPASVHAPPWVLFLAGLAFVLGGLAAALRSRPLVVSLLGNAIVASFVVVGVWVAFAGSATQFSGGFFFLSRESNVTLARWIFGGGAMLCLLVLAAGVRHTVKILDS